jgi:hypothetical protein
MERKETNRANQIPIDKAYQKGVKLIDVDSTISDYMVNHIIPDLEENGNSLKVPLIYGNAERWEGARMNGYLRDQRGRLQIPLVMFKRNSVERDESLQHFKEALTMPSVKVYSSKNRYERFSLENGIQPVYEHYNVQIPAYVTIVYEVMIWTSFTEHMNQIVEAFQYATDRYWGNENGFKFRTKIDTFDTTQEVAEGTERIVRTTFTMNVNAYLLPETFDNKPVVKKEFSKKRVVFGVETDLTGNLFTNPSIYNEYAQVIDFIGIRGSQMAEYVSPVTVRLRGVKQPILPQELIGAFDTLNWFRVYVNSDFVSPSYYTYEYNGGNNSITFTFHNLPFSIESTDEVAITGKFQQL